LFPKQKGNNLNNKGMSVAIASVILLSITIAVALAVTSWVGVISVNFMETEALWVSDISYQGTSGASDNQIVLTIENSGSYSVTILMARVTGNNVDLIIDHTDVTINGGESQVLTLNNIGWISGYNYKFDFLTGRGNNFVTTDSA
jgi:hypothetical protein